MIFSKTEAYRIVRKLEQKNPALVSITVLNEYCAANNEKMILWAAFRRAEATEEGAA